MFKNIYYKFLVWFFYTVGDIACRFDSECSANLYQKAMALSFKYDEQIGFWFWKEPPLSNEKDL